MADFSQITYFTPAEFACKCGCGFHQVTQDLVERLDAARQYSGVPFRITSGCRCDRRNKAVGGVENSAHTRGKAVDIAFRDGAELMEIVAGLCKAGFDRVGISWDGHFVHADVDHGKPWPAMWRY